MASLPCVASTPTHTVGTASTCASISPSAPGFGLAGSIPPACEQNVVPSTTWVQHTSNGGVDADDGRRGAMRKIHREQWTMFVAGNLISVTVTVSVICQLFVVCFHGYVGNDDAARQKQGEEDIQTATSRTRDTVLFTLTFGLLIEIFFAIGFSLIYRVPLDITSVHHIPLDALLSCGEHLMVFFLTPFSWALIYLLGGTASRYISENSSCEEHGGKKLELYLVISGMSMTLVGLTFLGISVVGLCSSLGSLARCTDGFFAAVNNIISRHMLSTGVILAVCWQLQGVVWSYRAGGFGLAMSIFVGMSGVVGALLPTVGILAPEKADMLTGELYV